jgi:hypothetical protein
VAGTAFDHPNRQSAAKTTQTADKQICSFWVEVGVRDVAQDLQYISCCSSLHRGYATYLCWYSRLVELNDYLSGMLPFGEK